MRDAETMEVALHAAETGHLVLSTLHTLNATETINRIISIFPPHQEEQIRDQLAAVIQGIVSQRLVPRADGKGRVPAVEVHGRHRPHPRLHPRRPRRRRRSPTPSPRARPSTACRRSTSRCCSFYREELITYETARDAATNPDDFDLKVKGILSTGEMTWDAGGANASPPPAQPRRLSRTPRRSAAPSGNETAPGRRSRAAGASRRRSTPRRRGGRPSIFSRRKAWSRRELTRRLERRGAPADVAAEVVADLAARGYLDDEGFARWWAQARGQGRRVGSMRLRQELLAKGISRELAAAAVTAAFAETAEPHAPSKPGGAGCAALRGRAEGGSRPAGRLSAAPGYPAATVAPRVVGRSSPARGRGRLPDIDDDGGGSV